MFTLLRGYWICLEIDLFKPYGRTSRSENAMRKHCTSTVNNWKTCSRNAAVVTKADDYCLYPEQRPGCRLVCKIGSLC